MLNININKKRKLDKIYKYKRLQIPIYDSMFLEIVVTNDNDKLVKRIGVDYWEGELIFASTVRTSYKKTKKCVVVVLNPYYSGNNITAGVIAHEAVHIKNIIFDEIGYENTTELGQDEPEAYLVNWLVDTIYDYYKSVYNSTITSSQ